MFISLPCHGKRAKQIASKALVHNDGGDITIERSGQSDHVIMTGPIELKYVNEV
jgi:diaminopimelate epimerase